jgi:hypothetical protein
LVAPNDWKGVKKMAYRRSMSKKQSKRDFSKKAQKVSKRNYATVMRGGYRV